MSGMVALIVLVLFVVAWLLGRLARAGVFGEEEARRTDGLARPRWRHGASRGPAAISAESPEVGRSEVEPEEARDFEGPTTATAAPGAERGDPHEDPDLAAQLEEQERVLQRWTWDRGMRRKEEIGARAEALLREDSSCEDAYRVAGEDISAREVAEDVSSRYPESPEEAAERRRGEAAERRRAHARGKRQLRSALGRLGGLGYWAFGDVATDDFGVIDQLLVGPCGLVAVRLMGHPGYVSFGTETSWWPPPRPGLAPERRPFEEDPYEVAISQVSEVASRVSGLPWEEGDGWSLSWPPNYYALCFTEAEVVPDEAGIGPPAVCDVWNIERFVEGLEDSLARAGASFGEVERREAVEIVAAAYETRPWLNPEEASEADA